jgi:SAM-dependent methyltransferase
MRSRERIKYALIRRKFRLLRKLRMNNFFINRVLTRADSAQAARLPVPITSLSLEEADYFRLVDTRPLHQYKRYSYLHSKPLEYLSTITLMDLQGGETILDAAGGSDAEYLKALKLYTGLPVKLYCQDALVSTNSHNHGITYIGGTIENVPLPDESLDCISCHHSFEHFQKDLDMLFIKEAIRLLRPNGKLIIIPLFLTNIPAEIWNERPPARFDADARLIYDFTAS